MTAAVAGTGAGRRAPGIHASDADGAAASDADGFRRAARLTEEAGAGRAVAEAAGRMRRALPQPLRAGGIDVRVTNPRRPRDFAGAGGGPAKTGRADAGAAPFVRGSGGMKGGRHASGGRGRPGDVLRMAATAAARSGPGMKEAYARLRERGKRRRAALAAVMRKLVVTADAPLRGRRVREGRSAAACPRP